MIVRNVLSVTDQWAWAALVVSIRQPEKFFITGAGRHAERRNKEAPMPRCMSFFYTEDQIRDRTKTVTRRAGWTFLQSGDLIRAVRQTQGLKKGEKVVDLAMLRVTHILRERLDSITDDDVEREGFPNWNAHQFVAFLCQEVRVRPDSIVTRIEFEYLN
jgi:hypothetical protein